MVHENCSVISPSDEFCLTAMAPKKNNRSKNGGKKKNTVPMTIQPVSRLQRAYCGYAVYGTISEPSATTGAIHQFRLNSIYDPDYTSTGSVAQGYGSYSYLYGLYRVLRTRAIVRMWSGTSANMTVGLLPGMNSTVTANYAYLHAQPFAVSACLQGNAGGEHSLKEWNIVYDLAKIAGVTKAQHMNDLDFAHTAGSNPVKTLYLTLFLNGHSGSPQSVGFEIRLVYEVEMSQPMDSVTG
jgi:hypothetical protein